ncbi:threonine/serine dehydratase [Saxibacter everestensis]|uniref:Threonine/serine dehydratase n=1 Tax=Saxibacter everestensis TaxID=2909229 RepID=A0ABY8QZA9_9MICO|nr:threonine/serine dehydratase [Brevibacteriaceae bacterium ZFBP1038]
MLIRSDVEAAYARIDPYIRTTPTVSTETGSFGSRAQVSLVCEFMQHSGSFKARGAMNRLLSARETGELGQTGAIAASGGNAGLGVAYAAGQLGLPATIYLPETAPLVKVKRLLGLGATVRQVGAEYAEAYDAARLEEERTGAIFVHAYDQPEVCAGQGTIGLQLESQLEAVDTVLVSVGGGGLLGGICAALNSRVAIVGVEPENIPTWHSARIAGGPVDVGVSGVAVDSLGARRMGEIGYAAAVDATAASVLVSDEAIVEARQVLWDTYRIVVELGTAAALAALTSGAYQPEDGERVAVILCGANTITSGLS